MRDRNHQTILKLILRKIAYLGIILPFFSLTNILPLFRGRLSEGEHKSFCPLPQGLSILFRREGGGGAYIIIQGVRSRPGLTAINSSSITRPEKYGPHQIFWTSGRGFINLIWILTPSAAPLTDRASERLIFPVMVSTILDDTSPQGSLIEKGNYIKLYKTITQSPPTITMETNQFIPQNWAPN